MSTINFYKGAKDKNNEYYIILVYQSGGLKFKHSTKIKTRKENWKKQRIVARPGEELKSIECNERLDNLSRMVRSAELEIIQKGLPMTLDNVESIFRAKALEELTERLVCETKVKVIKPVEEENTEFFSQFKQFIEDAKITHKASSIKNFTNTKNRLLDFQNKKFGNIEFEKIDGNFYKQLIAFLLIDCKFLNNTVGKHIKNLKTFINHLKADNREMPEINLSRFKVFREDVDNISLTADEVNRMMDLKNLSDQLLHVRNFFCFCCFTGLRFGDLLTLRKTTIKGDYLEIRTHKTKDTLKIPLVQRAKDLIAVYSDVQSELLFPFGIENQRTNYLLKKIAKEAEINEMVEINNYTGVNRITVVSPKHELVCSHTARRTFVTLSLEKGIRPEVVMSVTGHKDYRSFQKYIKLTDSVKMNEVLNAWN